MIVRSADSFVLKPDPGVRAVLLYGPDEGLVRERAQSLTKAVAGSIDDPFSVVELTADRLSGGPAKLIDEACAIGLGGQRKVIRVRRAGNDVAHHISTALESASAQALIVVEAGEIAKGGALRRLLEPRKDAAVLPCYRDEARDIEDILRTMLPAEGVAVDRDVAAYLRQNLGGDRQLSRRELEKLSLYAANGPPVTLKDVIALVGDSAALDLSDAALATADGDHVAIERSLGRLAEEGVSPIAILRSVSSHFQRLHTVIRRVDQGGALNQAMKALRPPVFWKETDRFAAQTKIWPLAAVTHAVESLASAEADCKRTSIPAEAVCGRTLFALANAARHHRLKH